MSLQQGTHQLGPGDGSLRLRTGREGAASKAGHDLLLEVGDWSASVVIGDASSIELTADPASIVVLEGTGGVKDLSDKDRQSIREDIPKKVLGTSQIRFASSEVRGGDDSLQVSGELTIADRGNPTDAPLQVGSDGTVSGAVRISQSDYGIKQYKAFLGALKVADEVVVEIEARLPTS